MTPVQIACKYGCEEVAELLINEMNYNKLIDLILSNNECHLLPLHLVCKLKEEKISIVRNYLVRIKQKLIADDPDKYNQTIENILKKQDENKQTILHISIEKCHFQIIELLLKDYNVSNCLKDLKEGNNGDLPIHFVAKMGSVEIFYLLQKYDSVSFKTNNNLENALHIASLYNRDRFINEFLKYEIHLISQNSQLSTPTSANCTNHFVKCACICRLDLSDHVPAIRDKDIKSYTPLISAIASSNQKCVKELIENSYVELNTTDSNGNSIYHISAESDNFETLKYLIDKLNPQNELDFYKIKNNFDETLLHLSCRKGNQQITNLIMNKLHETNKTYDELLFSKNKYGQNCFHIAVSKGYFNLVEYFLKVKSICLKRNGFFFKNFLNFIEEKNNSICNTN